MFTCQTRTTRLPGAVHAPMPVRPRVVVVDDDPFIRGLVAEYLEKNGLQAQGVSDGLGMWRALELNPPDLLVLDINLPGEDGLSLCRKLKSRSRLPVIMLTARGSPAERISGLEAGADDYLPKPFEPRELLARIHSVLRRLHACPPGMRPAKASRMHFAGWTLELEAGHLVDVQGVLISLSKAEFRLLRTLLELPNRVLSRDQLLTLAWERETGPFERSMDLLVSRLRRKLGDDAKAPTLIHTLHGEGYLLAASVTVDYGI